MKSDVEERLNKIFRRMFRDPTIRVTEGTCSSDVPGWDSLANLTLIYSIEQEFGIRFTTREIVGFKNVGDISRMIEEKSAGR